MHEIAAPNMGMFKHISMSQYRFCRNATTSGSVAKRQNNLEED